MSSQYVGEIRMFGGTFAPQGWFLCDGSLLSIAEFETLFVLIGTSYGGDGENTFALPDLRGRIPMHAGSGFVLAQQGGEEATALNVNQIPAHTHALVASSVATSSSPSGTTPAVTNLPQYTVPTSVSTTDELLPSAVAVTGGSQLHQNLSPYLGVNFIIAWSGIFPSS